MLSPLRNTRDVHYVKIWRHPQNRKYMTDRYVMYRNPSATCTKISWGSAVWFLRYASWQTDRQIDILITILRTPVGGEVITKGQSRGRNRSLYLHSFQIWKACTIRYSAYEFLLAFHSNHVSIMHRFWHISRQELVENRQFLSSSSSSMFISDKGRAHCTCIWRPLRVTPLEFREDHWCQEIRVPGIACSVVCLIMCL